jgi:DNA-binding Lrp family transcriptional regulator
VQPTRAPLVVPTSPGRLPPPRLVDVTTLDDTDRRILVALDTDPRATVAQLAMTLGLARGTVHSRLERLAADGSLRRNSTRLDPARLGLPMRALVTAGVDQDEFEGMVEDMSGIPEVVECLGISGDSDLMIQIAARDADHVYDITQRIMRCRGIRRTSTSIVLRELLGFRMDHLLG